MPPEYAQLTRANNPVKAPFSENQVRMTPERLELVWDNWRTQGAELASPSPYMVASSSDCSLSPSLYENSPRQLPPKSATKSGCSNGKRWGLFSPKKPSEDFVIISGPAVNEDSSLTATHKKSKLLKKKVKETASTPDLTKVNFAYHAPMPHLQPSHVPAVPGTPRTPHTAALGVPVPEPVDDSAMYFTVDPAWDESKGNTADLYLLPGFPGAATGSISGPTVQLGMEPLRKRAITSNARGAVKVTDNETSFLCLE
ncbi:hypothetical protein FPV67DRAFT_1482207 [Lyophyllum atratum]|nr:hypothetical protein FPV67DRAFT_1482207 [Lyophyllum atratum]